jgi:hypothetical protein
MPVSKYFVLALRKVVSGCNRSDSSGGSHWTCAIQEVSDGTCRLSDDSFLYGKCIGVISYTNVCQNVCDLDSFRNSPRPLAKFRCSTNVSHVVSNFLSSDLSPVKVLYSSVTGGVVK